MNKKKFFLFIAGVIGIILITTVVAFEKNNRYRSQVNTQDDVTKMIAKKRKDYNLVFYKRNCPYCEGAASKIISESKKTNVPTFFVDTESDNGRRLVKEYHVRYASTIIKIRDKNIQKMIYAEKVAGKYQAKQKVIDAVFGGNSE